MEKLLLTLPFLIPITAQQQQIQTVTLNNNSPAGTLRLNCPYGNPSWAFNDKNIYNSNQNFKPDLFSFSSSGNVLQNIQNLNGDYVGNYVCFNLDKPEQISKWNVVIPGASTLSGGAIAGIVIGVLLAIILIAGLIFFWLSKRLVWRIGREI